MRVLVCGGRDFSNRTALYATLYQIKGFCERHNRELHIIHGGARGADALANDFANDTGTLCTVFPADWNKHGRAAGPIRNQQMIDEGKPDLVVACPGGNGTADMVARAKRANLSVLYVEVVDSAVAT